VVSKKCPLGQSVLVRTPLCTATVLQPQIYTVGRGPSLPRFAPAWTRRDQTTWDRNGSWAVTLTSSTSKYFDHFAAFSKIDPKLPSKDRITANGRISRLFEPLAIPPPHNRPIISHCSIPRSQVDTSDSHQHTLRPWILDIFRLLQYTAIIQAYLTTI